MVNGLSSISGVPESLKPSLFMLEMMKGERLQGKLTAIFARIEVVHLLRLPRSPG